MHVFAITGGPMAGKSTCLRAVAQEFGDRVIVVPEVASVMFGAGYPLPGRDISYSIGWVLATQGGIVGLQRSFEDASRLRAEEHGARAMICDRGLLDGAAYVPEGLPQFCRLFQIDVEQAHARYGTVIHLETLARVAPERFGKEGNEQRYETHPDQAIELDDRLQAVWRGHPNHLVVPASLGIEGVVARVLEIVGAVVNQEFQRKWVLTAPERTDLPAGLDEVKIAQGYGVQTGGSSTEIRIRYVGVGQGKRAFLTCKYGMDDSAGWPRRDWTCPVPLPLAEELWLALTDGQLWKQRRQIKEGRHELRLDRFSGDLEGLVLLECVFADAQEASTFTLPPWAMEAGAVEVTGRPEFMGRQLAQNQTWPKLVPST
ncbi:AAA family ATPase [Candidatus Berkelbacteria bacterium]|nr:AAA family ATPase [Candidatus Berkelbacteria bacterium]